MNLLIKTLLMLLLGSSLGVQASHPSGTETDQDTLALLRKELALTQKLLGRTEEALTHTRKEVSFLETQMGNQEAILNQYRDTIRILKDGVYSYGQLFEEQQAFIDTLLESIAETPKASYKNYKSIQLEEKEDSEDAIQELLDVQYHNQQLMGQQQAAIDSLKAELRFLKKSLTDRPLEIEYEQVRHKSALDSLAVVVNNLRMAMEQLTPVAQPALAAPSLEANRRLNHQINILKNKNEQLADSMGLQKKQLVTAKINRERLRSQLRASQKNYLRQSSNAEILYRKLKNQERQMNVAGQAVLDAREEIEKVRRANEKYLKTQESQLRAYTQSIYRSDSLRTLAEGYKRNYYKMASVNDSLRLEVDLLSPHTESARKRRRVYQEQVDQLSRLQKKLPKWENDILARQKLLRQREKYLAEYQKSGDLTGLLDRIGELEKEVLRLNEILK